MVKKHGKTSGFDIFLIIFFVIFSILTLLPFMNIISISASSYNAVAQNKTMIFPQEFTLDAYYILRDPKIYRSFFLTVFIVVVSTVLHLFICVITAYPLSKKELPGRKVMLIFILITMLFGGGLIPYYMVVKSLGLIDNVLVFIIPGLVSGFNIILMKNFFQQIPDSIEEAAKIDGAGYGYTLFRIVAPLSKPILATLALFFGVGKWNDWFTSILFINNPNLFPIQNILRQMVIEGSIDTIGAGIVQLRDFTMEVSIKMAVIIASMIPIIIVYPFLQKHFVKGIFMGSVKS